MIKFIKTPDASDPTRLPDNEDNEEYFQKYYSNQEEKVK